MSDTRVSELLQFIIWNRQGDGGPCDRKCEGCSECTAAKALPLALELEQQVESLRAERDAVRDALLDAVQLLSVVPMSFPYNDRSQEVRAKAHIALNGIYAARKPVSQEPK